MHFFVGGQDLQAEVDSNTGRATINYVLAPGQAQTVTATLLRRRPLHRHL